MVVVSIKTKLKWVLAGIVVLICLAILVMAVSLNIRGTIGRCRRFKI